MSTIEDTTTPETAADNGIAIDHMVEVRGHIAEAPELGAFRSEDPARACRTRRGRRTR
jgi:hypothetical protein